MHRLFDFAAALGVTIEYAPLIGRDGEYRDDQKRIRLRENMTDRLTRWTLAHELGHAIHGHRPTIFGTVDAKQERQADEWAALQLIDIDTYREVERLREGHAPSMAHDLGIVTEGVHAFQRMLERLGDDVYLKPCHGAGQYADRLTAYRSDAHLGQKAMVTSRRSAV